MPNKKKVRPAKPEKMRSQIQQNPNGFALVVGNEKGPGVFLLLWLIAWTVGCVFLASAAIKQPSVESILFGIPFWSSWFAVAGLLVWLWFGKEKILISATKVLFLRQAWITISSREIPVSELRGFRECKSKHTENDRHLFGIELESLGKPLQFGFRLPNRERAWLLHELNQQLASRCDIVLENADRNGDGHEERERQGFGEELGEGLELNVVAKTHRDESDQVLTQRTASTTPPSDTSWQLIPGIRGVQIRQKGSQSIAALFGLFFLNAFWNGIVGLFVLVLFGFIDGKKAPQGVEFWGMFVFLIPFVVIGVVMFLAWLAVAIDPFRATTWTVDARQIQRELRYFGFGWKQSWPVQSIDRLEKRRTDKDGEKASMRIDQVAQVDKCYALAFVTSENRDLCTIDGLTQGEAQWIAHLVFEQTKLVPKG